MSINSGPGSIRVTVPEAWIDLGKSQELEPYAAIWVAAPSVRLVLAAEVTDETLASEWDIALRRPHVRVRFGFPVDPLILPAGANVMLAELLVPLLPNGDAAGCALVRDRGRVVRFARFPLAAEVGFWQAVAAARP